MVLVARLIELMPILRPRGPGHYFLNLLRRLRIEQWQAFGDCPGPLALGARRGMPAGREEHGVGVGEKMKIQGVIKRLVGLGFGAKVVGVQMRAKEADASIGQGNGEAFSVADVGLDGLDFAIANVGTGDENDFHRVGSEGWSWGGLYQIY